MFFEKQHRAADMITVNDNITLTKDYDKFIFLGVNRDRRNNANLKRSMEIYGWLTSFPLTCTSYHEIIDGQHRLDIARNLSITVPYVINDKIDQCDIPLIQCGTNWTMTDFLKHFSKRGLLHYTKIKQSLEFGNMNIGLFLNCFGSSKKGMSTYKLFRIGEVCLTTYDFLQIDKQISMLNDIHARLKISKDQICEDKYLNVKSSRAIHTFFSTYENYDHKRFIHALEIYPDALLEILKFHHTENIVKGCIGLYNRNLKNETKKIKRQRKQHENS